MLRQERTVFLPRLPCTQLLDDRHDRRYAVCRGVLEKDVDMIPVCFHSPDVPVVPDARIEYVPHDIHAEAFNKDGLSVLRNKDKVDEKQVPVVHPVLISII